jgi:hypothetical protein
MRRSERVARRIVAWLADRCVRAAARPIVPPLPASRLEAAAALLETLWEAAFEYVLGDPTRDA